MKHLNFVLCLVSTLVISPPASAAPLYNIVPLGLDDLEHTNNDGFKLSNAVQLNAAGQVIGSSDRYSGGFYHGAQRLALRRRDHDQHRPHGQRAHHQLRRQVQ